MKAILMSIRPQWVAKILNGEKIVEIRKKFPSDYVGWVYIYNTKDIKDGYLTNAYIGNKLEFITSFNKHEKYRGKVVARFWCDKVECAYNFYIEELCQLACIDKEELYKYAGGWYKTDDLLAIHIDKVEIFNEPKDISEFLVYSHTINGVNEHNQPQKYKVLKHLARAPQSWCWIER